MNVVSQVTEVLNDGNHLQKTNAIITFLTNDGVKTPKLIWVGEANDGIEITGMTKADCIAAIERHNKLQNALKIIKNHQ